ncbi:unnamed protein product [Tilletia controversa]|nr:unnamed protein product [Tilletia controversa]
MRRPRSPGYPLNFNGPGPSGGYGIRGHPSHPEGPPLTNILAPPSGFGPLSKGLLPLSHRRHDTDPNSSSSQPERMLAPIHDAGRLPPHSNSQRPDRDPQSNHGAPHPPRNDRFPGPEATYPVAGPGQQPPFLPSQGGQYHPDASSSAAPLPLAYSGNSEGPLPAAQGVPGSLSSLGSQVVADRRPAKQQPSFVNKLYSMLEDERIAHMISWAPSGTVFSVANPSVFSKVVLPQWFKHSNWQSFVRQLNMYGFNKVNQTFQGDPVGEIQVWEFRHPRFRRGEVHLLNEIKRKNSRQKRAMSPTTQSNSGGDYESRRGASPTPSPEMSSLSMDEHARQMSDSRMRGEDFSYMAAGPPTWPVPNPAHTGMPFAHDGAPNPQGPPPLRGPMGLQGGQNHPAAAEGDPAANAGLRDQTQHRLDDMSDRVDAIIRHSNYLEAQLRTVSERLHQSQEAEQAIATHMARTLNVLISLDHTSALMDLLPLQVGSIPSASIIPLALGRRQSMPHTRGTDRKISRLGSSHPVTIITLAVNTCITYLHDPPAYLIVARAVFRRKVAFRGVTPTALAQALDRARLGLRRRSIHMLSTDAKALVPTAAPVEIDWTGHGP